MKFKKAILFISILFIGLTGAGCSFSNQHNSVYTNNVTVGLTIYDKITQTVALPAFTNQLKKDYSQAEIEGYIVDLLISFKNNIYKNFHQSLFLKYSSDPKPEFAIGGNQVYFEEPKFSNKTDQVFFTINFKSVEAYNYYHTSDDEDDDEKNEGNLFVKVNKSDADFPFSAIDPLSNNPVGNYYKNIVFDVLNSNFPTFQPQNLSFEYFYETYQSRLHSNCDQKVKEGELYKHSWFLSDQNLSSGKQIEIFTNSANRQWWYVVLIGVTFVLFVITIVVYKVLLNKKLKEGNKD